MALPADDLEDGQWNSTLLEDVLGVSVSILQFQPRKSNVLIARRSWFFARYQRCDRYGDKRYQHFVLCFANFLRVCGAMRYLAVSCSLPGK